jgi:hypothetical protein
VNAGLGFDLAGRGPGIVFKSRFEWDWGARPASGHATAARK